ncbi:MAG: hypothetical protein HPY64_11565 [Anaerolineae bacterium]|nr:hypothetical protein [Anaerolineae bacterium]
MSNHPLAEVFGFPTSNQSQRAKQHREHRLCPYNNHVPNCTKDKADDPLGVCSIFEDSGIAITCPIRFRQDWLITIDAAKFFFQPSVSWTSLTEVRLNDKYGKSAGNIDIVLVAYENGRVVDFGSLEVQAVYISGNIRRPFQKYMENPEKHQNMDWSTQRNYPRPDYLSSSRKRLVPQLLYKGGILKSWRKKQAVAIHSGFFDTLPSLQEVECEQADIAWLIYDLELDEQTNVYQLRLKRTVYTMFKPAIDQIITAEPGSLDEFVDALQEKLEQKLENRDAELSDLTLSDLL